MAESQDPYPYTPGDVAALKATLSPGRYATYLTEAKGNDELALGLYLYNARLAKAFLYPLAMAEVALRNANDGTLVGLHGPGWPQDAGFRAILSAESLGSLDKALNRTFLACGSYPRGQVVATLTFDFWSNLFRPEYDRSLWQVNLRKVLPHAPTLVTRRDVQVLVRDINRLRNRIAHHEPILSMNVTALHADIVTLLGYRCPVTAGWVRHFSTISTVIRTKPRAGQSAQTAGDRCDTRFQAVRAEDRLHAVLAAYKPDLAALVCVDEQGQPMHLLTATDVATFIAGKMAEAEGMVAFGDHTVADLVASGAGGQWAALDIKAPTADIAAALTGARPAAGIVVTEMVGGIAVARGVIVRAHRRY